MATRFRLLELDEQDRKNLTAAVARFFPREYENQILDSIENEGRVPPDILSKINLPQKDLSEFSAILDPVVQKLAPDRRGAIKNFLARTSKTTEADMTDEELAQKQEAFRELGSVRGAHLDTAEIERQLDARLKDAGVDEELAKEAKPFILKAISESGKYPGTESVLNYLKPVITKYMGGKPIEEPTTGGQGSIPGYIDPLVNFVYNQNTTNYFSKLIERQVGVEDTSRDVTKIEDILTDRRSETAKEGLLQSTLAEIPGEQTTARGRFLAERESGARRFLAERAGPQILAELNVRGLAEGPDVASALAQHAGRLQAGIEDTLRQIASDDDALFEDAAFRLRTAKLEQSEADFRASVQSERDRARLDQFNRFNRSEADIQRDFETLLLEREAGRKFDLSKGQLKIGEDTAASDLQTGLVTDIAANTSKIVTGKVTYGKKKQEDGTTQPSPKFDRIG